jgi:glycerol-3-phosphate acyltransferase PlsX
MAAPLGRVRLALDAMGGDHGATEVVPGGIAWADENPDDELILVGDESAIHQITRGKLPANARIVHGPDVIGMDEHPAQALRERKGASILVATNLVREGVADAVVTAGHTGAGMAAAVLRLGRLPGVDRPALAVQFLLREKPLVLLDVGANPDATSENLYQYAHMGSIFSEHVLGVSNPRVALLSIGEEKGKGDQRIQKATELLDLAELNFTGNVEGRHLAADEADVVVCDAVLGNVSIKLVEGVTTTITDMFREEFRRLPFGPLAAILMRPAITRIRTKLDYERIGGAVLLGVKGSVVITHGRARKRMVTFACGTAARTVREGVSGRIARSLAGAPPVTLDGLPSGPAPD